MSKTDDAKKFVNDLRKQGRAVVVVSLVAYANDLDFTRDPPSCRVTVIARDPEGNIVDQLMADIPNTMLPYKHQFNIKVESVIESLGLGKYFGSPKKRNLVLDVVADPIGGYQECYESDSSLKSLKVSAGSEESRNVSLKPKKKGSRFDRTTYLDKPRPEGR